MSAFSSVSGGLDHTRAYSVLICDLIGLTIGEGGEPDFSEVRAHIEARGGIFHQGPIEDAGSLAPGMIHFFYLPDLSAADDLVAAAGDGRYDAVIAAATFLPADTVFPLGGVRIGAGTGNMGSMSWGGGSGEGGTAPLMNTPGINSRATAQMVMKAILKVLPDLPVDALNARVTKGDFDTGRELRNFPTEKLEGKTIGVVGYGNIGREVAKLARAFGMRVVVHARAQHRKWIESEGLVFGETMASAAADCDVLTVHVGLGALDPMTGKHANAGLIDKAVLDSLRPGAVLVNYDRGELVDIDALADALESGRVRHAAIDADLFRNAESGVLSGPMLPYLRLVEAHGDKLELLPHAAADTDHPSRVDGARQAVDQILEAISHKIIVNLKGSLPEGYQAGGERTPRGIGAVTSKHLLEVFQTGGYPAELAALFAQQTRLWDTIARASEDELAFIGESQGETLVRGINRLLHLVDTLGIQGPYRS
jgi:lactate dehydrogenase-like 2-hydroxyacid dehydrogenase